MWLVLPPMAASVVDVTMTLVGQGSRYWSGDFGTVDEFNPLARLLLAWHPGAFVAAAGAWWVALLVALFRLNPRLSLAIAFIVTFLHGIAAAGWMVRLYEIPGAVVAVLFLIALERLLSRSWTNAGQLSAISAPVA